MLVSPPGPAARFGTLPGASGASVELLTTAGTSPAPVVKLAASLPVVSWMACASLPEVGSS